MTDRSRLSGLLDEIDKVNAADPTRQQCDDGQMKPAAMVYGQRMSEVLAGFAPEASEALQIAVRAQHIERWKRRREDYAEGKAGYLQWRRDAAKFHADRIASLMAEAGYDFSDRERVAALVRKEGIKSDHEAQTLEDVACLVFMRWYFADFASSRSQEELLRIVEKTARKMSPEGRRAALRLPLPADLVPAVTAADA